MSKSMSDLIGEIIKVEMAAGDTISGCSSEEIKQLEADLQVNLPGSYKEFLKAMGKSAGQFLNGSDVYYPDLEKLKESSKELLKDNGNPFKLRPQDFVFFNHQGYQFMYFDTTAGDDPPVLRYIEGQSGPEEVDKHFSNWLVRSVKDECELFEENKDIRAELGLG